MKKVESLKVHRVSGDSIPRITASIGDGHLGTSILSLDSIVIHNGDILDRAISDTPADLSGKTVTIETMISTINRSTKHTSITYRIGGPGAESEFVVRSMITNEGDPIVYITKIALE